MNLNKQWIPKAVIKIMVVTNSECLKKKIELKLHVY